jgi:hypothetical protein
MDEELLLRRDFDELIDNIVSAQTGGPEYLGGINHIGDKVLSTLELMARAGNANAVKAIIRLARTGVESFTRLAELNPDSCKEALQNAKTMPALLSPLPSVGKKYKVLQEKLGLGRSHWLHGKNWNYYNPVNRFVINCIDEIDNVIWVQAMFPGQHFGGRPEEAFVATCLSLPELSRDEAAQNAWRKAIKELVRLKRSSSDADLFDFQKLPGFHQVRTRARVKAKHDNAALFEAECWKDISRALVSLAT